MAIDYTSGGPQLKGGLDNQTMNIVGEASRATHKVGDKYAEKGLDNALDAVANVAKGYAGAKAQEMATQQAEEAAKNEAINKKLDKVSEEVNAIGGSLGDNYFEGIYDGMEDLREEYLNATDDKSKAKVWNKINEYKAEVQGVKEMRASMADSFSNGLLSDSMSSDDKHVMEQFLSNKTKVVTNEDGTRSHEVTMPDGTMMIMSADEISDLQVYKANEFDKMLTEDMQGAMTSGQQNGYYDSNETRQKIKNSITDENIGSLINDPMGGGGSFKNDLKEGLENSNLTYKDLGGLLEEGAIQPQNDEEFWYDNISPEDIQALTDALTNPNNQYYNTSVTKEALTNYFSSIIDNNNTKGVNHYNSSRKQTAQDEGETSAIKEVTKAQTKKELTKGDFDPNSY